jgi:hypothetical protein
MKGRTIDIDYQKLAEKLAAALDAAMSNLRAHVGIHNTLASDVQPARAEGIGQGPPACRSMVTVRLMPGDGEDAVKADKTLSEEEKKVILAIYHLAPAEGQMQQYAKAERIRNLLSTFDRDAEHISSAVAYQGRRIGDDGDLFGLMPEIERLLRNEIELYAGKFSHAFESSA